MHAHIKTSLFIVDPTKGTLAVYKSPNSEPVTHDLKLTQRSAEFEGGFAQIIGTKLSKIIDIEPGLFDQPAHKIGIFIVGEEGVVNNRGLGHVVQKSLQGMFWGKPTSENERTSQGQWQASLVEQKPQISSMIKRLDEMPSADGLKDLFAQVHALTPPAASRRQ